MILSFKTKINGKPTYFPEKIITGLFKEKMISRDKAVELFYPTSLMKMIPMEYHGVVSNVEISQIKFDNSINHIPKIHTIRTDEKDRWKKGVMIDFFINTRKPDMFRFAPKIPVISVQDFEISYFTDAPYCYNLPIITVDGKSISKEKLSILSRNDGFEDLSDFFKYFNQDFKGKIIHWTDLKY